MDRQSGENEIEDSFVWIRALEAHLFVFEPGVGHAIDVEGKWKDVSPDGKQLRGEEDMNPEWLKITNRYEE